MEIYRKRRACRYFQGPGTRLQIAEGERPVVAHKVLIRQQIGEALCTFELGIQGDLTIFKHIRLPPFSQVRVGL